MSALDVDKASARLVLELMTPMAIEMTLAVQTELDRRIAGSEHHHQLRVTRAQYETDAARRRFMLVDPANRLVAAGLETEWNTRLSELAASEQELDRFRSETREQLSDDMRRHILALTCDLPRLWADPTVINRERKEILAHLIEDVTILSEQYEITAQIRLRGGACRSLTLEKSRVAPRNYTSPDVVTQIDQLLQRGDDAFVAEHLNTSGIRNPRNLPFTKGQIGAVRKARNLPSHCQRRVAEGYARVGELAARYAVTTTTIRHWANIGLIERSSCGEYRRWYYRIPSNGVIVKGVGGPYAKSPHLVPSPICHSSETGAV